MRGAAQTAGSPGGLTAAQDPQGTKDSSQGALAALVPCLLHT